MRMRKKKHADERLDRCRQLLAEVPETPLTDTERDFGRTAPLWLEIGAGKGGFACGMTAAHPDICYYAMERVGDCVVLAAERAAATEDMRPDNLRFIIGGADSLPAWFAPGTTDAVFLNFSDPWSKAGHYKRRLTYRRYLAVYFTLLKDGGTLRFKTDNEGLFRFTLDELAVLGLTPDVVTDDLHHSPYDEGNIRTEYETHFAEEGLPIHMLSVTKPAGFVPLYEEARPAKRQENAL